MLRPVGIYKVIFRVRPYSIITYLVGRRGGGGGAEYVKPSRVDRIGTLHSEHV